MSTLYQQKMKDKRNIKDVYIKNSTELITAFENYLIEMNFSYEMIEKTNEYLKNFFESLKIDEILMSEEEKDKLINTISIEFQQFLTSNFNFEKKSTIVKHVKKLLKLIKSGIKRFQEAELFGRNMLIDFLCEFNNQKKKVDIDLVCTYKNKRFYVEIERDNSEQGKKWINPITWPYPVINMPVEKERYFWDNCKTAFYLKFSRDLKNAFILHGLDILEYGKEEKVKTGQTGLRLFIRIPNDRALFAFTRNVEEFKRFIIQKLEHSIDFKTK